MGLLDFNLDNLNSEKGILGLLMLSQAAARPGPRDTAGGLLQAFQGAQQWADARSRRQADAEDRQMRRQLMQAQIGETNAQAQQRAAQLEQLQRRNAMFTGWLDQLERPAPAANALTVQQTGSLAPTVQNAGVHSRALDQVQQQNPLFGIPPSAIRASLAFDEGKSIPEWMFKRGTPNIDFVNGLAVDKNRTAPGFSVPTISASGQGTQLVPDPSAPGGFRIIAPQGAVETYAGYRRADEQARADLDLVKVYDPQQRREVFVPRSVVASQRPSAEGPSLPAGADLGGDGYRGQVPPGGTQVGGMRIPPQVQRERDVERLSILRAELARATDPADRAALQREIGRLTGTAGAGAGPRSGPLAAGPSSLEAGQAQYDVDVQKDFAVRRKALMDAGDAASGRISNLNLMGTLLAKHDGGALSERGLEIASAMNSLGLKVDTQLGNKLAAVALQAQLTKDAVGGSLGVGVSNADTQLVSRMVPNLSQSADGRRTLIGILVATERRKQEVAGFARRYEEKYGRLDGGFYTQLQAWADANPLFDRRRGP